MKTHEICGAIDVQWEDGKRVWCTPAWVAARRGKPFNITPQTITRPYWTTPCDPQCCGPELTDEEIESVLKDVH